MQGFHKPLLKALHKMLERLEWEPLAEAGALQSRRTASRLIMFKKIQTGQVAIPAQKFLQPVSRPTRHNTKPINGTKLRKTAS